MDGQEIEKIMAQASKLGEQAENVVNEVLHGNMVKNWLVNEITDKTPVSTAKIASWHPIHAKMAKPYTSQKGNLSVTIKSKKTFNYLYFPDDGSNTRNHAGMQHFMLHGAEKASEKITEELIKKIVDKFVDN